MKQLKTLLQYSRKTSVAPLIKNELHRIANTMKYKT